MVVLNKQRRRGDKDGCNSSAIPQFSNSSTSTKYIVKTITKIVNLIEL